MKKKVLVAMSGGVDSSVTANLLKNQGYDVSGVFLRLGQISYLKSLKAARSMAEKIGIPLWVIDLRKRFKKEVIGYFLKGFACGETPNPCIVCNKKIKFKMLFDLARKSGFDYLATGHYVRLERNLKSQISNLKIAHDREKDQSYFLYNLKQNQLKHLLFPLGDFTKEEVKLIAKEWKLPCLTKESYDICFLSGEHGEFLRKHLKKAKGGRVLNSKGEIIGMHHGLPFYTIGQRAGLGGGRAVPYYIVEKNIKKNLLIVASKADEKKFYKKEVAIKNVNWISGNPPISDVARPKKMYKACIRYRQPLQSCHISSCQPATSTCHVEFIKPQRAVTPGQSLVLYKGSELLGGGIIK